ncbi:hypothetical protein ACGF3G_49700 [Streptomyces sp. NPDC048179]|uniref:hypothetical protein n=1 Tax=Streptomyces sp. NPDC048179 TaxID=3365506 RepID=UPI00371A0828
MTVKVRWSPRKSAAAAAMTAMLLVAPVIAATDAQALGNNREVWRSCGSNRVSSGYYGSVHFSWAQTVQASGDCTGRLSAALERINGYWTQRVYGDKYRAYATDIGYYDEYGLHWGCDACNVTRS